MVPYSRWTHLELIQIIMNFRGYLGSANNLIDFLGCGSVFLYFILGHDGASIEV